MNEAQDPPTEGAEDEAPRLVELVHAAKAGDRDALEELFTRHEPMMIRWARRRLGQPLRTLDETRDVLHDAWQVVLRKMPTFEIEDSRSFARWLRGIITRVVLQKAGNPYLKKRDALRTAHQPQDLALTPMTALTIEDLVNYRYRLLRGFPRTDRLVYRLRLRGWSASEIADRLGVTDRAVRQRFAKTDARIRLQMKRFVESGDGG